MPVFLIVAIAALLLYLRAKGGAAVASGPGIVGHYKPSASQGLVDAVIAVESGGNPRAVSSKGAMGLMQLMPATAREWGVSDAFDPSQNVAGGTAYLNALIARYDGDVALGLAAYNAGPGRVDNYLAGRATLPGETQDYVRNVLSRVSSYDLYEG